MHENHFQNQQLLKTFNNNVAINPYETQPMNYNEFKFTVKKEVVPESTYWPSGVKVASMVAFAEESILNPHFCTRGKLNPLRL